MVKKGSIKDIITKLFDEYPKLASDDYQNNLLWSVWTQLGYTDGYSISYKNFMNAPFSETVGRIRREVIEEHPLYKLNALKYDRPKHRRSSN